MIKFSRLASYLMATAVIAYSPSFAYADSQPQNSQKSNEYSLGLEGFHDRYREPSVGVTDTTDYGSITGSWTHYWPMMNEDSFLLGTDGRFSYGKDSYKSPSGISSGAKEDEFDGRIITGVKYGDFVYGSLSPYIGLGLRYFVDNGKGNHTNLGAFAYDRRITQGYVPIGMTYNYAAAEGWTITPNIEFDPIMRGNVNSRLNNGGGFYTLNGVTYKSYNIDNKQQHNGYGLRGSIMLGWTTRNVNFQAGPFIRYWRFENSDVTIDPNGNGWIEPKNTRTQVGMELKAVW